MSSFNKEAWRVARSANKYMIEVGVTQFFKGQLFRKVRK